MIKIKQFASKASATLVALSLVLGGLTYALPANAGTGLSVAPNFPSPVTAGQTGLAASLVITNASTADEGNVTLSSVTLTPSCGDNAVGCSTPDADVFAVSATGTGMAATSCSGDTFNITEINATTGEVSFARQGGPLVLGFGASCTIEFTVDVLKVPTIDVNLIQVGSQTNQLGAANGTSTAGNPASGTGADVTTINKAQPAISTIPTPETGAVGDVLNDTASVTGGANPTGSVTFNLFNPADSTCQGPAVYTEVDGTSPYATSPGYTSLVAGTYRWTADYSGDANNEPASSGCTEELVTLTNPLVVTKTVDTAYDRKWNWTIDKSVDNNDLLLTAGETYTVNYTVTLGATSEFINESVFGSITIHNPVGNPTATIESVTDQLSLGGAAVVDCGGGVSFPYELAPDSDLICGYTKSLSDPTDQTNTATVTTSGAVPGGSSSAMPVVFGDPDADIDECVTVSDTNPNGPQGVLLCQDAVDKTFNYSVTFGPEGGQGVDVVVTCGEIDYPNIASFETTDNDVTGQDSANVHVNVNCFQGCTLTQGYWKTHNFSFKGGAPLDDNWNNITPNKELSGFFTTTNSYPVVGPNASTFTWFNVFWTAPKGNVYYNLAHQYMAAKLNILNGASTTPAVDAAITNAETWFATKTPSQIGALKANNALRKQFIEAAGILGSYNEGLIGPGHCDEQNPV